MLGSFSWATRAFGDSSTHNEAFRSPTFLYIYIPKVLERFALAQYTSFTFALLLSPPLALNNFHYSDLLKKDVFGDYIIDICNFKMLYLIILSFFL